jgi:mRNA interferase RelE/StbE
VSYAVIIGNKAKKELGRLPSKIQRQLAPLLRALHANSYPAGFKKLQGGEGYRCRSGDYRILYDIDHEKRLIQIFAIRHRKDAYK